MCSTKLMLIVAITCGVLVVFIIMLVTLLVMKPSAEPPDINKKPNNTKKPNDLVFMSRADWNAREPLKTFTLDVPVPYVIILQTNTVNCTTKERCLVEMVNIQNYHMDTHNKVDILFNFLVGGDGTAFEGRGWKIQGFHTNNYNNISVSVAFIGTFNDVAPPKGQVNAAQLLIQKGIDLSYVKSDYKLLGDRQLSYNSNNPGGAFFEVLKTWPHWSQAP